MQQHILEHSAAGQHQSAKSVHGNLDRSALIENQIARIRRRGESLDRLSRKYWTARRYVFFSGVVAVAAAFEFLGGLAGWIVLGILIFAFAILVRYHRIVLASIRRNQLWIDIKTSGLARIALDWKGIRKPPSIEPDPNHPFELDIDITGERSLHHLLDTCLTTEGSERLRRWLLDPVPDFEVIKRRQKLVAELSTLTLFREKARIHSGFLGSEPDQHWEAGRFLRWLQGRKSDRYLLLPLIALSVLSVVDIALFVLFLWKVLPAYFLAPLLLYVAISFLRSEDTGTAFIEATAIERSLKRLLAVFEHLERYSHSRRPELAKLCTPFLDRENRPSELLKKVTRVTSALSFRVGNPYLWGLVELSIPWDFYFAYLMNGYRERISELMPVWLEAWFELEALISLADFAYLNPDYAFPVITSDARERPDFTATQLGHPLLPRTRKVCNDFELGRANRIALLTGSNMSGKSTFLRTLGVNLRLAYAGAPVNADRMVTSLFSLFTCIKVSDSVADGLSYFYAEVKRLKALLSSIESDSAHHHFVLIDEIFRGTNNRERRIGSWAYIKRLATLDTLGAVATHDLDLVKLADEIPAIENYHFKEDVMENRMIFDYQLRQGPSPTTNALKIMQMEGLPVDAE